MTTAKILVMDDELSIRLFLEKTLIRDGHTVVTAASGEEALELIANQSFDLALLDLKLTGIGGLEVLAALREQAPDTVVIILTAQASLESAVEALRQGAHDYLFKPCQTFQLRESIQKGLAKRQQALQQRGLLRQLEQNLVNELETIRATMQDLPPQSTSVPATTPEVSPTKPPEPVNDLIEPLSERELEVLRLLAAGMSNQEIAEEFIVTIHTVKWHTKNLYGKLNVHNRTQALVRARELGLI
ncbi:MAG: response regulator transcription factor [Anaerolineae bacterium]|nr:response regulator transcription factor [Anaerolineae bacterium]